MSPAAALLRRLFRGVTAAPWSFSLRPGDADAPASIISGAKSGRVVAVAMSPRYGADQFVVDARAICTTRNLLFLLAEVVEVAGDVVATLDALSRAEPHQKLYAAKVSVGAHEVLRQRLAALEAAAAKEGE